MPEESNNYLGYDHKPENKAIQLLCVHVIEYSAYQSLQDRIQRLEACLALCKEQRNHTWSEYCEAIQEETCCGEKERKRVADEINASIQEQDKALAEILGE